MASVPLSLVALDVLLRLPLMARWTPQSWLAYGLSVALGLRNVVPIRVWSNEGFSLTRGDERYMFTEWRGEQLYDRAKDPLEQVDLLPGQPLPGWVREVLEQRPDLAELRERFGHPAALDLPTGRV